MISPIRFLLLIIFICLTWFISEAQNGNRKSARSKQVSPPKKSPNDIPGQYWKECDVTDEVIFQYFGNISDKKHSQLPITRDVALSRAKKVSIENPAWYSYLPPCPLTEERIKTHVLFEESNDFISCFHSGAQNCYRSSTDIDFISDRFELLDEARHHAQQCCYINGLLQVSGRSAGTPDFVNSSYRLKHLDWDVRTWMLLSLNEYHTAWLPNKGEYHPFRVIVTAEGKTVQQEEPFYDRSGIKRYHVVTTHQAWNETYLQVNKGDKVDIKVIRGSVNLGRGISVASANGIPKGSALEQKILKPPSAQDGFPSDVSGLYGAFFKRPKLDDEGNFGGLIATLYAGGIYGEAYFVGTQDLLEIYEDGYLQLAVNDNSYDDNTGYFIVEIKKMK